MFILVLIIFIYYLFVMFFIHLLYSLGYFICLRSLVLKGCSIQKIWNC